MNAKSPPLSRAQQQALSAPLLVEDENVVSTIARIADERGTPMQEIIRLAVECYLQRLEISSKAPQAMRDFWLRHPLPLPTGLKADKRFFDALSGDL